MSQNGSKWYKRVGLWTHECSSGQKNPAIVYSLMKERLRSFRSFPNRPTPKPKNDHWIPDFVAWCDDSWGSLASHTFPIGGCQRFARKKSIRLETSQNHPQLHAISKSPGTELLRFAMSSSCRGWLKPLPEQRWVMNINHSLSIISTYFASLGLSSSNPKSCGSRASLLCVHNTNGWTLQSFVGISTEQPWVCSRSHPFYQVEMTHSN